MICFQLLIRIKFTKNFIDCLLMSPLDYAWGSAFLHFLNYLVIFKFFLVFNFIIFVVTNP